MDQIPLQLDREGIKEREDGERDGGGDYSREAVISNISIKGGWLFEGGNINQWTAFIQGNVVIKR